MKIAKLEQMVNSLKHQLNYEYRLVYNNMRELQYRMAAARIYHDKI